MARKRAEELVGWISEHPSIDYAISLAVILSHVAATRRWRSTDWLVGVPSDARLSAYGTGAQVIATLGGLAAIAVGLYQASTGHRAGAARKQFAPALRRNWRSLLSAAALLPLLGVMCLLLFEVGDLKTTTGDPHYTRFFFEFVLAAALLRFVRLIWLFDAMLKVIDQDMADPIRSVAPEISAEWINIESDSDERTA